ncbi:SRPBCC family protein [Haloechinothrix halophila]|uniref:SRPBCC family protein n=1 Tax=Haloechinothrix halophila TaxID=1069073 RepID=UPI000418EDA4|nr:SRPBCC family protein [Haloechinothrix halophila]
MAEPTAQSSIEIAAPPELVYELVSDVPNLPDWAAEIERCSWIDGATGPAVGAKFTGRNEHKKRKWGTLCIVTAAEPGREFAFQVRIAGAPSALWRYQIEPTDTGCRVTESTRRLVPRPLALTVNRLFLGIRDRDNHNQANIERTLAKLKEHAESLAAKRS